MDLDREPSLCIQDVTLSLCLDSDQLPEGSQTNKYANSNPIWQASGKSMYCTYNWQGHLSTSDRESCSDLETFPPQDHPAKAHEN